MKFTSTQENFNQGISLVANLAGRSAGLPILNNVLLEVKPRFGAKQKKQAALQSTPRF